jgi:hypothetical protein
MTSIASLPDCRSKAEIRNCNGLGAWYKGIEQLNTFNE